MLLQMTIVRYYQKAIDNFPQRGLSGYANEVG